VVAPAAGAVVLVRFPFSDLSNSQLRPAVVLADAGRGDRVLCQITSKPYGDARAVHRNNGVRIRLAARDELRPARQTLHSQRRLIAKEVGMLAPEAFTRVVDAVMNLLRGSALDQP
jgi:mRNA interferase MazF